MGGRVHLFWRGGGGGRVHSAQGTTQFVDHKLTRIIQKELQSLINSLTTEKQTTKFSSANFQKMLSPSYIILRIQRLEGKQCRSR